MITGIFWFLFSVGLGIWASKLGKNGFIWFLASALLSPIITGILFYFTVLKHDK